MPTLVFDCPRCGVKKHTFDIKGVIYMGDNNAEKSLAEAFCFCRACGFGTIFVLSGQSRNNVILDERILNVKGNLNPYCKIEKFVSIVDMHTIESPKHLPPEVEKAFSEGAKAYSVGCWNASACMFRASIDIATRNLLPEENTDGLDDNIRRSLARRLKWLFNSGGLQKDLEGLTTCVKEDGNEAIHSTTLSKDDAIDLLEFTVALLERIYTEPEKVRLATQRRSERRAKPEGAQ